MFVILRSGRFGFGLVGLIVVLRAVFVVAFACLCCVVVVMVVCFGGLFVCLFVDFTFVLLCLLCLDC